MRTLLSRIALEEEIKEYQNSGFRFAKFHWQMRLRRDTIRAEESA
jgi:hypothetical protein